MVVAHGARAEAQDAPTCVPQREDDSRPEAVVEAAAAAPLDEAGRLQIPFAEAGRERPLQHAVPGARRIADSERLERLPLKTTSLQVLPRLGSLARVPEITRVERRCLGEQLVQPLAVPAPLLLTRIGRVVGELDAVAVGEPLERLGEVEALLLLDELEDVASRLATEAVVELLGRVDREARRTLVVER